jgi:hypothetical protein
MQKSHFIATMALWYAIAGILSTCTLLDGSGHVLLRVDQMGFLGIAIAIGNTLAGTAVWKSGHRKWASESFLAGFRPNTGINTPSGTLVKLYYHNETRFFIVTEEARLFELGICFGWFNLPDVVKGKTAIPKSALKKVTDPDLLVAVAKVLEKTDPSKALVVLP